MTDVDLRTFDHATEWIRIETVDGEEFEVCVVDAEYDPANSFAKGWVRFTLEGADWETVDEAAGTPTDRAVIGMSQDFTIGRGEPKTPVLFAFEELDSPASAYTEVEIGEIETVEEIPSK